MPNKILLTGTSASIFFEADSKKSATTLMALGPRTTMVVIAARPEGVTWVNVVCEFTIIYADPYSLATA